MFQWLKRWFGSRTALAPASRQEPTPPAMLLDVAAALEPPPLPGPEPDPVAEPVPEPEPTEGPARELPALQICVAAPGREDEQKRTEPAALDAVPEPEVPRVAPAPVPKVVLAPVPAPTHAPRLLSHQSGYYEEERRRRPPIAAPSRPDWNYVPEGRDIAVIDTETTGLTARDRLVSFGAVILEQGSLEPLDYISLVFSPGKRCHPKAFEKHGLSDAFLKRQPPIERHAKQIKDILKGKVLVAHNLEYDLRMLNQSLNAAGVPGYAARSGRYCTMLEWRHRRPGQRASLAAVMEALDLPHQNTVHGALEDACLAALLLRYLHGKNSLLEGFPPAMAFQNAAL